MGKDLIVTVKGALEILEKQDTPESKAIVDYVQAVRKKDIAVLGEDECFVLQDKEGQIRGFKRALVLSQQDGTLVKPGFGDNIPHVVSAQGYEKWAEFAGVSVIFPKQVVVYNELKSNPYPERDPKNGRIVAVHCCAVAFGYSPMGIPQVSSWTTIFDTPSYRMIDLLSKAKQYPQAFKVLPKGMIPESPNNETWASYPFDESVDLYYDTSHKEVMKWLSQILNREKKAMDFAQTFAKRNALKHLSGLQKAPGNVWKVPVIAWRPTGNNIVKWDATQYAELQDRVVGMIEGSGDEFAQIEMKSGSERTSEEDGFEELEATVDPEDSPENEEKPDIQDTKPEGDTKTESPEVSKNVKQVMYLAEKFAAEFEEACKILGLDPSTKPETLSDRFASELCEKISDLVDAQN